MTKKSLMLIMAQYLEAITSNDLSFIEPYISENVKITNNAVPGVLGKSDIWGYPRRIPTRMTFADPVTGNVVFYGVVTNATYERINVYENWWYYFVRLKIENEKITQIEEIYQSEKLGHFVEYAWDCKAERLFKIPLLPEERSTRKEMVDIANLYWDAVAKDIPGDLVPFHPDAQRVELGNNTNDQFCLVNSIRGDFRSSGMDMTGWEWKTPERRYPIIDVEHGLMVSMVPFKPVKEVVDSKFDPGMIAELFRIENGMISWIFAIYRNPITYSGWEDEVEYYKGKFVSGEFAN